MTEEDARIEKIEATPECYGKLIECVCLTFRRRIPRVCRTNYIHGLAEESESPYEAYQKQYSRKPFDEETLETGDKTDRHDDKREKTRVGRAHHLNLSDT